MTRPDLLSSPYYRWTYRTIVVVGIFAATACAAFALAPGWIAASCSVAGEPTMSRMEEPVHVSAPPPHAETLMEKIDRANEMLDCLECKTPKVEK